MSSRTALIFVSAAVLVGSIWWWESRHAVERQQQKSKTLAFLSHDHHRMTKKISGPLEVELTLEGERPQTPGDVFTLVGTISSGRDLENIELKWIVPPQAEVVSGSLDEKIGLITTDQPITTRLVLQAKHAGPLQIHLRASGENGGLRFASMAQFNSQPRKKDFGKDLVLEESQIAEEQGESATPTQQQKVFH